LGIGLRGTTIANISNQFARTAYIIPGALSLLMGGGMLLAYRNVARELALAKLKSDFVSNVFARVENTTCAHPLVTYSDGVLECRNTSEEEFGLDRILAALRHADSSSAQATLMLLLATLQDFANGSPLCDDVSLTVIQR
jgi:hypothetical protein